MIMLCNLLEALHSMTPPIINRDIKPSNIIITSYNYAMLLAFNAAKQFSGQHESDTVLIGTPGYEMCIRDRYGVSERIGRNPAIVGIVANAICISSIRRRNAT